MDDDTLNQIGYSDRMRDKALSDYNQLMMNSMNAADWGSNHKMEWIQAYLIIGLYWNSADLAERHLTWLGMSVKVCILLL